jgi:hypothetical protein
MVQKKILHGIGVGDAIQTKMTSEKIDVSR